MSLLVEPPSPEQQDAGIVARFEFRDDDHAFAARGVAKRGERGLTIARLEIDPDSDDVSGSLLRHLRLGELLSQIRASMPTSAEQQPDPAAPSPADRSTQRHGGRAPLTDVHTRKNGVTDDLLRQVATSYLTETGAGKPPGALQRLAVQFGRPEKTVQGWIARARTAGWLGPGSPGRMGAEPGPRLRTTEQQESAA